jgi:hypothetical protein
MRLSDSREAAFKFQDLSPQTILFSTDHGNLNFHGYPTFPDSLEMGIHMHIWLVLA